MKVLVSDPLGEIGIKIFEKTPGIDVDVKTGLSPEQLKEIIGQYDGLVIRSATRVTADILSAATRLKAIGRAGIGLDNVDIPAATQRGIAVMNTPFGNTITTAEHTISMLMSLSRNIPQATMALKQGRWEKKKLQGRELFNKTLGLIGYGNIGSIVADLARGLKMNVIVFDPYINPKVLSEQGLTPVALDDLLGRSDYITIHTPRTEETTKMINKTTLAKMKRGAMLINCARGGIVNEDDLYESLACGHLGGAALDVFEQEPPGEHKLMSLPNFICTPHLGASTKEAQENVAKEVAEQMVDYLLNGTVKNAVNVPNMSGELITLLKPFATLAEKIGLLQAQLVDSGVEQVSVRYCGKISEYDVAPMTSALLKGMLTPVLKDDVNYINAPVIAKERGIKVVEAKTPASDDFASLIVVKVTSVESSNTVSGTIFGRDLQRILRINDFYLEAAPQGPVLLLDCANSPGVMGRVGTILGEHGINIDSMQMGRSAANDHQVAFIATSSTVSDEALYHLANCEGILANRRLEL